MTRNMLCAVDGSEYSNRAVALAGELAAAGRAELTFLAVNVRLTGGALPAYTWESADVKRMLESAVALAKKAGVSDPKRATVESRDAARAIVVYAEDHDIDHIVIGKGGKEPLLGWVSDDVIARAHCPVTVAR